MLSAREADALRVLLAARQQAGGGPAPVRRPPARRGPPPARRARRSRSRKPVRPRAPWAGRLGIVAAAALLLPMAVTVGLPGPAAPPTAADVPSATRLAVAAHASLLARGERYRVVDAERTQLRADLATALAERSAADAAAAAARGTVGVAAADLFRDAAQLRLPVLGLDAGDPASVPDVLFRQAMVDRQGVEREGAVVRAERAGAALAAADRTVAAAERAVSAADARAAGLLADARAGAGDLDPGVAATIAGLSDRPATEQQDRGRRAIARWQRYLSALAAAGIEPPSASDLSDPARLPRGFSPALDDAGSPVPGVAWAVIGASPVTVLPAETVAAVSSALSQLGTPFAPGATGPDAYDCGGFTAATWLRAGFALPSTPAEQWRTGSAVPVSALQIGDLVLSPGGLDVGLYLGGGDVLGASAATYRVGVRALPAGSTAVRVTLGPAAEPNRALATSPGNLACGATPPPARSAGPAPNPSWGGWRNGQIPADALCALGVHSHALRCDAAAAYTAMSRAYAARFGTPLCITDSYRSFGAQLTAFALKPGLAAVPGTSNHGWALAVDLCDGVNRFGTPQWRWMAENAGRFGWVQPPWAGARAEKPEPWHWEFGVIS